MTERDFEWMQERWEALARENAEYFIWTDVAAGDDFAASGERDVSRILDFVAPHLRGRSRALEFGCGIGRLTLPISRHFERVVATDIAPTMLARLEAACVRNGITNVTPIHVSAEWDRLGPMTFTYSHIVFQHIESWPIIEESFRRIAASLASTGVFYAQFDTRPATAAYRARNLVPEFALPRVWQRGVRRIRRPAAKIRDLAHRCGLVVVSEIGSDTADTAMLFARSPAR